MLNGFDEKRLFAGCQALKAHIAHGSLWYVDGEIIGKASDGIEVSLGTVFAPADAFQIETYLVTHPTPDTW